MNLVEPLMTLALLYQQEEDHDLATAAIERARQAVRVNHGLYSLEEAPLLRLLIQIEEAKGDAKAAWVLEQRLLNLVRRHPNDLRTVPILLEVADRRMDVLTRYSTGEFPPEIVLGCYYAEWRHDQNGLPTRSGCRAGSRRTVLSALAREAGSYRIEARSIVSRHERWLAAPCDRPHVAEIPEERRLSRREVRSVQMEVARYLTEMSDYVACIDVKYERAASTNASPSELARRASDKGAAVEELEELSAAYEERIGPITDVATAH